MQVIAASNGRLAIPSRRSLIVGAAIGGVLVIGGLTVAWLAFGTPFISRFAPVSRPTSTQVATTVLAWTFAVVAPMSFLLAGVARIAALVDTLFASRGRRTSVIRMAQKLPDDYVVVSRSRLSDGRVIPDLVVGPFGLAVIEDAPSPRTSHRNGDAWEVRTETGSWIPIENPLDKAARDAGRVRRWLAQEDHDFVVKVHAAVVAKDASLTRTVSCAVITQVQIPAWLAALPIQRSLSASRRARLVEVLRSAG